MFAELGEGGPSFTWCSQHSSLSRWGSYRPNSLSEEEPPERNPLRAEVRGWNLASVPLTAAPAQIPPSENLPRLPWPHAGPRSELLLSLVC